MTIEEYKVNYPNDYDVTIELNYRIMCIKNPELQVGEGYRDLNSLKNVLQCTMSDKRICTAIYSLSKAGYTDELTLDVIKSLKSLLAAKIKTRMLLNYYGYYSYYSYLNQ